MPSASSTKAERIQQSHVLRAKAPIAARFEDCSQASIQLTDALQANRQGTDELRALAQRCTDRLGFWGDDSGASSRILDYALACSPTLMRQTDALLVDLSSTLEKAVAASRTPLLLEGEEPFDLPKGRPIALLPEDEDADTAMYLEEALEIVDHLVKLLPALRDPMEEDVESSESQFQASADWYHRAKDSAAAAFREAPPSLIQRLVRSHRRRKQNLHWRERSRMVDGYPGSVRADRSRTIPANWPRQLRRRADKRSNLADSDAGISTVQSHSDTVMSRHFRDDGSQTSVTTSQLTSSAAAMPPATTLGTDAVECFDCPYCHSEVPLALTANSMTLDEWIDHVFLDLKPYICTFGNCHRGDKAFGTRKEWFQHELDFHRSRIVWSCGACRKSYKSENEFVRHLKSSIRELDSKSLAIIVDSCKRYSQEEFSTQCPLCRVACTSLWDLEDHLGRHLEKYALEAVPDHDMMDDEGSEIKQHVAEFVADQTALHEPNHVPSSTEVKTIRGVSPEPVVGDVAISRVTEVSDASAMDDPKRETGMVENIPLTEKIGSYLHDMPGQLPLHAQPKIPSRDKGFVGRQADLQKIHESLYTPGQICTITGRGGSGKTATAIEYLYQHSSDYEYIFWVEAETPGTCQTRYNTIADFIDVGERSVSDDTSLTFSIKQALSKLERRWLVVFDNVGTWPDISRYIPRNLPISKGSVLITSRSGPQLSGVSAHQHQVGVRLEPWGLNHSREFLLTSISPTLDKNHLEEHEEYHLAEKVVDVVDRLPLAVSMVVGYIKVSRCNLAEFLEMWEERATSKKSKKRIDAALEAGIDGTIDALWDIGIREVRANCRKLLDVLSFLDPEAIPKSLLVGEHEEEYLDFLQSNEKIQYKRMIEQLERQRLITVKVMDNGEQVYSIHRVLQQKIQFDMDDYSYADAFRKAFRLIRKKFPSASATQVPNTDNLDTCKMYMPHVYSFDKVYREHYNDHNSAAMRETKPEDLAELFYDAGFYVWAGQTTAYDGISFLEAADNILNKISFDPDAKLRADIYCMTGLLLLNMGYAERARGTKCLKAALQIRKNIYAKEETDENDILLQNAANDYALSLMNEYRFGKAGDILRECHERYKLWGPEEENPFENSKFYGNYSAVLLWENKIDEAIEYIERCLEFTEKFTGNKGSQYYRRLFWLGNIVLQSDDYQRALDIHLEVLQERLKIHGKHNENTILSMYAVGAAFHYRGDLPSAIEHIEQSIEAAKNHYIPPEAYGRAHYHLALLYEELGGEEAKVQELKAEAKKVLDEFAHYAPDALREADSLPESHRIMMIFDDMQGTFQGRYTGHSLLKYMRHAKAKQKQKQAEQERERQEREHHPH
jgi:tetratricopeptide (TPR) repeat protein